MGVYGPTYKDPTCARLSYTLGAVSVDDTYNSSTMMCDASDRGEHLHTLLFVLPYYLDHVQHCLTTDI